MRNSSPFLHLAWAESAQPPAPIKEVVKKNEARTAFAISTAMMFIFSSLAKHDHSRPQSAPDTVKRACPVSKLLIFAWPGRQGFSDVRALREGCQASVASAPLHIVGVSEPAVVYSFRGSQGFPAKKFREGSGPLLQGRLSSLHESSQEHLYLGPAPSSRDSHWKT